MRIGVLEAKNRLSQLIEAVGRGEEVIITKRGQPVASLSAFVTTPSREAIAATMRRVAERRNALGVVGTWAEWRQDRDQGRRF